MQFKFKVQQHQTDSFDAHRAETHDVGNDSAGGVRERERREAMTEFEKRREGLSGAAGALRAPDPRAADLRAPGEDDDGYDPYSDYMDAWGRADDEEPCEDPWR